MGNPNVSSFNNPEERKKFTKNLLIDILALEKMLEEDAFEDDIQRIGAEQELALVGEDWYPALTYNEILKEVNDPLLATELARFNLEINLEPLEFTGNALSKMHDNLEEILLRVRKAAKKFKTNILLTGILPTIRSSYLDFEYMTPNPRYSLLNDIMSDKRKSGFDLNIKGIDELIYNHPNILFEACNTSFQVHLQVSSKDFVSKYNWAQAIAGPVLAICANSPLLLGKRLWKETRIALFQQSIDTRDRNHIKRSIEPRVYFGNCWLKESVTEIYQGNITRFKSLFTGEISENSIEELEEGNTPKLKALCLHNGTVYSWNRVCYGASGNGKPHLRIENRYLPSGPTTIDEMSNAAFWLGLMNGMPDDFKDISELMNFEDVRYNFYNAARIGIESNFRWMGKTIPLRELLSKYLIPWAIEGLRKVNILEEDIEKYIGVIKKRTEIETNGSTWTIRNFNQFLNQNSPREASVNITRELYKNSIENKPVHEWKDVNPRMNDGHNHYSKVGHLMTGDVPTVNEDDIIELVVNILDWRNVRYIAVENNSHELVGLIGSKILIKLLKEGWNENRLIKEVMQKNVITVNPTLPTNEALEIMTKNNIGCLPVVVRKNRLIGMVTEREIVNAVYLTSKFKTKY